jgi:hypothetical protein
MAAHLTRRRLSSRSKILRSGKFARAGKEGHESAAAPSRQPRPHVARRARRNQRRHNDVVASLDLHVIGGDLGRLRGLPPPSSRPLRRTGTANCAPLRRSLSGDGAIPSSRPRPLLRAGHIGIGAGMTRWLYLSTAPFHRPGHRRQPGPTECSATTVIGGAAQSTGLKLPSKLRFNLGQVAACHNDHV